MLSKVYNLLIFQLILLSMSALISSKNNDGFNYQNGTLCVVYDTNDNNEMTKEDYNDLDKISKSFSIIKKSKLNQDHNEIQIACAEFDKREGWHILNLHTFQPFSNEIQSYFAGYLEGYIYHELIGFHYTNIFQTLFGNNELPDDLKTFMRNQEEFVRKLAEENTFKVEEENKESNVKTSSSDSKYYFTLKYVLNQFDGLYQGQLEGATKYGKTPLSKDQMYQIAMQADLNDLLPAFSSGNLMLHPEKIKEKENKAHKQWEFLQEKECSGYVKFNKKTKNLISSHNTHNLYSLMNRIFKFYNFDLQIENKKLNKYKFSSRPADMNSKDDYYTLSNNMVVIETSLNIWDLSIYKNLRTDTVPKWIRVNIANKLAENNVDWIRLFFKYNSGTHNNQWLIVDYNKFEEYLASQNETEQVNIESDNNLSEIQSKINSFDLENKYTDAFLDDDFNLHIKNKNENSTSFLNDKILPKDQKDLEIVHLVEQIPVLDKAYFKDFSAQLIEEGYVASYNAPYFDEVINLAGYKAQNHSDYFTANRNFLFKKYADKIESIEDVKVLMRFHDEENICDTIAPRCDMVQARPFGSVDAKITDSAMLKEMKSVIIYGPPHIKGISEPFDFGKFPDFSHLGIPDYFDFDWIEA